MHKVYPREPWRNIFSQIISFYGESKVRRSSTKQALVCMQAGIHRSKCTAMYISVYIIFVKKNIVIFLVNEISQSVGRETIYA